MRQCSTRLYYPTAMPTSKPLLLTVLCCCVLWGHLATLSEGSSVAIFNSLRENSHRKNSKDPKCYMQVSKGPNLLSCQVEETDTSECSRILDSTMEKTPEELYLVTQMHYTDEGEMRASISNTLKTFVSTNLRVLVSTSQNCWSVLFKSIPRRDNVFLQVVDFPILNPGGNSLVVDNRGINTAVGGIGQYTVAVLDNDAVLLKKVVYITKDNSEQSDSQLDFREVPEEESDSEQWSDVFPDRGEDDVTLDPENHLSINFRDVFNKDIRADEEVMSTLEDGDDGEEDEELDTGNVSSSSRRIRSTCELPPLSNITREYYYDRHSAAISITLSTNVSCTGICCEVKVTILKHMKADSEKVCSSLKMKRSAFNNVYQVTKTAILHLNTPFLSTQLGEGCYTAQFTRGKDDQLMNPFLWGAPLMDIPDLNRWNTTFSLRAKPELGEIEVRWQEPPAPFNFTHYSLQLWFQASPSLSCDGHGGKNSYELRVQPTPSKALDKAEGVFDSLPSGYYCARVTPIDDRCPDGCAVRTSHTVFLSPPSAASNDSTSSKSTSSQSNSSSFSWEVMIGIISTSILVSGVLVCSMVYLVREKIVNRNKEEETNGNNSLPGKAPLLTECSGRKSSVLLVYTLLRDTNGVHKRRVKNLKKMLSQHLNVYDYLDLSSMEANQRELLLQNPASWLQTLLLKTDTKLLLMMSPSSSDWMSCVEGVTISPSGSESVSALDRTLYPYTLRLVSHNTQLIGNYSKVFVSKFEDCATVSSTTDKISLGRVYLLPLHLNTLVSAISGETCESCNLFSDFEIQEFVENCQEPQNTPTNCV